MSPFLSGASVALNIGFSVLKENSSAPGIFWKHHEFHYGHKNLSYLCLKY